MDYIFIFRNTSEYYITVLLDLFTFDKANDIENKKYRLMLENSFLYNIISFYDVYKCLWRKVIFYCSY